MAKPCQSYGLRSRPRNPPQPEDTHTMLGD